MKKIPLNKTVPLQLITLDMDNGQQGVFVGVPLMTDKTDTNTIIENIWFSDVQDIPDNLTVDQLIKLVGAQMCRNQSRLQ
jgi:hypothetical protein